MEVDPFLTRLRAWWYGREREQKISVVVLSLFSVVAVVFSIMHIRAQIVGPFMVPTSLLVRSNAVFDAIQAEDRELTESRIKDTDHDGLTDYAELNIYRTSPYLADTDSDAVPDSVEIAQETNPLCPEGKECVRSDSSVVQGSASSSLANLLDGPSIKPVSGEVVSVEAAGTAGIQSFLDKPSPPDQMTPSQIRTYLVSHGLVNNQQISGLTDEMIVQVYAAAYQEAIRVQAARTSVTASSTTSTTN